MADISDDIVNWSATASANNPTGGTAIGAGLDDNLRAMQAATAAWFQKSYAAFQARLTLTSGLPVTTADVMAAETIYLTPYKGNQIWLYSGTIWKAFALTEIPLDVPDVTGVHDVFCYDNAGTPTLEALAWSNDTTRATALTYQNGILVKSGATTRRYVGTFYSTTAGNGQVEDSYANRYLWNYYNRVFRPYRRSETDNSWSDTTASIHQVNSSASNQFNFVVGVSEDAVEAVSTLLFSGTTIGNNVYSAPTLNATTNFEVGSIVGQAYIHVSGYRLSVVGAYRGFPGIGKQYISWNVASSANVTLLGDGGAGHGMSGMNSGVWG